MEDQRSTWRRCLNPRLTFRFFHWLERIDLVWAITMSRLFMSMYEMHVLYMLYIYIYICDEIILIKYLSGEILINKLKSLKINIKSV